MEISSNRINPYPPALPEPRTDAASERRFEQDRAKAEKQDDAGNNQGELVGRGEASAHPAVPDYAQVLQRARLAQAYGADSGNVYSDSRRPRLVQQALTSYQELSNDVEISGIELLPRIDDYA